MTLSLSLVSLSLVSLLSLSCLFFSPVSLSLLLFRENSRKGRRKRFEPEDPESYSAQKKKKSDASRLCVEVFLDRKKVLNIERDNISKRQSSFLIHSVDTERERERRRLVKEERESWLRGRERERERIKRVGDERI